VRGVLRAGLGILGLVELGLGTWTQFFPESFYRDFPTVGLTPPFSEHLMRDFGGATLGLAIVLGAAAWFMERRLVVVALAAYLVFSVPHFLFHMAHLHDATSTEVLFLVASLGGSVLVPSALLAIAPRTLRRVPKAE
jgi:hypothetical protein